MNFVGTVVAAVSGLGLVLVVTRLVERHTAGQFFAATAAYLVLVAIASLGTDAGLGRLLPRVDPSRRSFEIRQLVRAALVPVLLLSVLIAAAVVIMAPALTRWLGLDDPQAVTAVRVLGLSVPAFVIGDVFLAVTRALGVMRTTVVIDRFFRVCCQVTLVVVAVVAGVGLGWLTSAWVAPYLGSALLAWYAARAQLRRIVDDVPETEPPRRRRTLRQVRREFWGFTWARSVAKVSQMVIQRADIVIIGVLLGPSEAAIYTAATRFVPLGQFATQAIQLSAQPRFSMLLARGQLDTLRELYRTTTTWSMALAWPLYLVVGAAPFVYLWLFGSEYAAGASVCTVMAAGMLVGAATGPVDTMLLMAGRSTKSLINSLIALAIDLALCVVLVPRLGIIGAALAWSLAVSVRALMATWQVHRELGLRAFGRPAAMVAGLAVLCFAVPFATLSVTEVRHPGAVIGVGALTVFGYAAGLWALRRPLRLEAFRGFLRNRRRPDVEVSQSPEGGA